MLEAVLVFAIEPLQRIGLAIAITDIDRLIGSRAVGNAVGQNVQSLFAYRL